VLAANQSISPLMSVYHLDMTFSCPQDGQQQSFSNVKTVATVATAHTTSNGQKNIPPTSIKSHMAASAFPVPESFGLPTNPQCTQWNFEKSANVIGLPFSEKPIERGRYEKCPYPWIIFLILST
jgi:hypothetical protein